MIFRRCVLSGRRDHRDGLRVHWRLPVGYRADDGIPMYGGGARDHHRTINRVGLGRRGRRTGVGLWGGDRWSYRVGLRGHDRRTHRTVLLCSDLLVSRINGWVLGRDGELRGRHTY